MSTERAYQAALIHLEQELDGFAGAAFVEASSGVSLGAHSIDPGLDQRALIDVACATVTAHLELGSGPRSAGLREVIVTTSEHFHLYQVVFSGVLLVVSAACGAASLGLVKVAATRCAERLRASKPVSPTDAAPALQ